MRKPLDHKERQRIFQSALGSQRIAGLSPSPEALRDAERWVNGELTAEEGVANILRKYQRPGPVRGL